MAKHKDIDWETKEYGVGDKSLGKYRGSCCDDEIDDVPRCENCGSLLEESETYVYCPKCFVLHNRPYIAKTTKKPWYGSGASVSVPIIYRTCDHWRKPVRVGRFIISCSAYYDKTKDLMPFPDLGIYLSTSWQFRLGSAWSNSLKLKLDAPYPAIIVDWPDMGVLPYEEASHWVDFAIRHIMSGKKVDIGCQGGHGRTGTFYALLLRRLEGLNGDTAIQEVRRRLCKEAIESKSQIELIQKFK